MLKEKRGSKLGPDTMNEFPSKHTRIEKDRRCPASGNAKNGHKKQGEKTFGVLTWAFRTGLGEKGSVTVEDNPQMVHSMNLPQMEDGALLTHVKAKRSERKYAKIEES